MVPNGARHDGKKHLEQRNEPNSELPTFGHKRYRVVSDQVGAEAPGALAVTAAGGAPGLSFLLVVFFELDHVLGGGVDLLLCLSHGILRVLIRQADFAQANHGQHQRHGPHRAAAEQ